MNKRTMVKKVNVYAPIPIRTVTPPIHGRLNGVAMTPANILKCLIGRATVFEVLSDGSLLRLTQKNYNTVNKPVVKKNYPAGKVGKQAPAFDSTDEGRTANIVLKETESTVSEENLADAEPVEIVMENKPNLDYDSESSMVCTDNNEATDIQVTANNSESTFDETSELATTEEAQVEETEEIAEEVEEEDPELAEIAAEIERLEAEEAAAKENN